MKNRIVKAKIQIAVPVDTVLKAFLEKDDLIGWWGVEQCLIEPQVGGIYALAWGISEFGINFVSTGIILAIKPKELIIDRLVYFNPKINILGPMVLKINLEEVEFGTEISVIQSGYQQSKDWDWYYEAVKRGWPQAFNALKLYLEK